MEASKNLTHEEEDALIQRKWSLGTCIVYCKGEWCVFWVRRSCYSGWSPRPATCHCCTHGYRCWAPSPYASCCASLHPRPPAPDLPPVSPLRNSHAKSSSFKISHPAAASRCRIKAKLPHPCCYSSCFLWGLLSQSVHVDYRVVIEFCMKIGSAKMRIFNSRNPGKVPPPERLCRHSQARKVARVGLWGSSYSYHENESPQVGARAGSSE